MESLVAAFMRLPLGHFGYNMGALRLNKRVFAPHELMYHTREVKPIAPSEEEASPPEAAPLEADHAPRV